MLRIRFAEEAIGRLVESGRARAPCHLGIGREAIAVGVSHGLIASDRVLGPSLPLALSALGGSVYQDCSLKSWAKLTERPTAWVARCTCTAGKSASAAVCPLVGATIPLAVGAGLAARLDGGQGCGCRLLRRRRCRGRRLHESMNWRRRLHLPVLFVCENNLLSSHLHITLRQPSDRIARYAGHTGWRGVTVNGNDVAASQRAQRASLLDHVRAGQGPLLGSRDPIGIAGTSVPRKTSTSACNAAWKISQAGNGATQSSAGPGSWLLLNLS